MRALLARMVMVVVLVAAFTMGFAATASATSGTAAVSWANAHNGEVYGTAAEQPADAHQWSGYCWTFVYDAFGGAAPREDTAQAAWDYYAAQGKTHTGAPPAGTIAFWSYGTDGHAAVAVGGGMTVGTRGTSSDRYAVEEVAYDNRGLTYLGWVDPNGGSGTSSPIVTSVSLPNPALTVPYSQALAASGGSTPYVWSVSGALPDGLSLSTSGLLSGLPEAPGTWTFTVTVTDANMQTASQQLALTVGGRSQAWYTDATSGGLRHAWWTGQVWQFETLDGAGSSLPGHTTDQLGGTVAVTLSGGQPQAFYRDVTSGGLRHAWWTGQAWQFEILDGPGSSLPGSTGDAVGGSVAVLGGNVQAWYTDATSGGLRHAWWTGQVWQFETLDGPGSSLPGHTTDQLGGTVAITLSDGQPQAFYRDVTTGGLRHAWWTGQVWQFETLDGPGSTLAGHTSDAVGASMAVLTVGGRSQAWYTDATSGGLRHAWWTGQVWQFETLDGAGSSLPGHTTDQLGGTVAVTLSGGQPQAFYRDVTSGGLRHAWWTGQVWQFEILDGPGSSLPGSTGDAVGGSVAVLGGNVQAWYTDATSGGLRHAWWTGQVWQFETLDGPGSSLPGHTTDQLGGTVAVAST